MKYTDSSKPLVCMQTQSTCYNETRKMTPKGILWHSTGANNPTLKRYVQPSDVRPPEDSYSKEEWLKVLGVNKYKNDWNHIEHSAGLNCWIGKLDNGTVTTVQTMPWDYRPWGCGAGARGSCNNGWIQFEICEDGLINKEYFEKIYKEACEITAYLCKIFNLDPMGTVDYDGIKVPVILCHQDSYQLGLGCNHGDVYHWFKKYGKTMDDVRSDVAALIKESNMPKEIYRIRKSWNDVKSQIGAYQDLNNAKKTCDMAGVEYKVYNSKGERVYPEIKKPSEDIKIYLILSEGAKGQEVKDLQSKLTNLGYDLGSIDGSFGPKTKRAVINFQIDNDLEDDGICGPKTWKELNSAKYSKYEVTANSLLNIRSGPGLNYRVKGITRRGTEHIIVSEKNGWARLINNAGWVSRDYIRKI